MFGPDRGLVISLTSSNGVISWRCWVFEVLMLKFLETLDHAIGRGERWLMVALTAGLTLILCRC